MPRYLVTTHRDLRQASGTQSALEEVQNEPDLTVVNSANPDMVTIEASKETAEALERRLSKTHFVEPEVRRQLNE
jgi:bisphosphoglycerate-independent phosphoglycerate mutase (AlkP superfamily)